MFWKQSFAPSKNDVLIQKKPEITFQFSIFLREILKYMNIIHLQITHLKDAATSNESSLVEWMKIKAPSGGYISSSDWSASSQSMKK